MSLTLGLHKYSLEGKKTVILDIEPPCSVRDIIWKLALPPEETFIITVNGRQALPETELHPGDKLKIFPMLAGG